MKFMKWQGCFVIFFVEKCGNMLKRKPQHGMITGRAKNIIKQVHNMDYDVSSNNLSSSFLSQCISIKVLGSCTQYARFNVRGLHRPVKRQKDPGQASRVSNCIITGDRPPTQRLWNVKRILATKAFKHRHNPVCRAVGAINQVKDTGLLSWI